MRVLGLGESSSVGEIKRAYRRLAQELHPDKHGGDEASRRQFMEVANAYRMLMRKVRSAELGQEVGTCPSCLTFDEMLKGLDGQRRCRRCTLQGPRRLLPAPVLVVVKCIGSTGLIITAAYLLVLAFSTGKMRYAAGAFGVGLLAIGTLAHTCLTVLYCSRRRRGETRKSN